MRADRVDSGAERVGASRAGEPDQHGALSGEGAAGEGGAARVGTGDEPGGGAAEVAPGGSVVRVWGGEAYLRSVRALGEHDVLDVRAEERAGTGDDRWAGSEHRSVRGGWGRGAVTERSGGGVVSGRSGAVARVFGTARSDGAEVHPAPLQREAWGAAVPHGRPGAVV